MITVYVFGGHPVKVTPKVAALKRKSNVKKPHPIEKNPRVRFFYPHKDGPETLRDVRVIGANDKYVVGLQINDKNRFKKFLKSRMTHFTLAEFSPLSVS